VLRPRRLAGIELARSRRGPASLGIAARSCCVLRQLSCGTTATCSSPVGGSALATSPALRACAAGLLAFALRVRPLHILLREHLPPALLRRARRCCAGPPSWDLFVTVNWFRAMDSCGPPAGRSRPAFPSARHVSLGHLVAFGVTVASAFLLSPVLRFLLRGGRLPAPRKGGGIPYAISVCCTT
jgi:hypothetical protein